MSASDSATSAPTTSPTSAPPTSPTTSAPTTPRPSTTDDTTSPTSPATSDITTPTSGITTPTSGVTPPPTSSVPPVVITEVTTPLTTVVIGTSTITSTLPASTRTSSSVPGSSGTLSPGADTVGSSGLSSGARAGIIAGSVVGGLAILALLGVCCLAFMRKKRRDAERAENIRWPEIAASAEDRAALYPQSVNPTGRAGLGDMEEVGAFGAAGAAAGAAGLGRQSSLATTSSGRYTGGGATASSGPTLPRLPMDNYDDSELGTTESGGAPTTTSSGRAANGPGPASIDYMASRRSHASLGSSSAFHANGIPTGSNGSPAMSAPASPPQPQHQTPQQPYGYPAGGADIYRPVSPHDMQVGDNFVPGAEEQEGAKRGWRLSVVNN